MKNYYLLYLLLSSLYCLPLFAEHPIDVQKYTAEGLHFESLVSYEKIPVRRRTREAHLAAAKSAWAVGLVSRAKESFEGFLRNDKFSEREKAEIEIQLAIIEYQENNYQVAMLYAERAAEKLPSGSIRAQSYMVWGDSLLKQKLHGQAQSLYKKALEESAESLYPEIHYRLGMTNVNLGKYIKAEEHFKKIPLDSERIPFAIRELAKIAIELKNYKHAMFWLDKGKDEFPDHFIDSWVSYAELSIAASIGDIESVRDIRKVAEKKYPPSDHWLTILQAVAEKVEWTVMNKNKTPGPGEMRAQRREE